MVGGPRGRWGVPGFGVDLRVSVRAQGGRGLVVELELQLLAYTTATATATWDPSCQAVSVTYTAAHSNTRSLPH